MPRNGNPRRISCRQWEDQGEKEGVQSDALCAGQEGLSPVANESRYRDSAAAWIGQQVHYCFPDRRGVVWKGHMKPLGSTTVSIARRLGVGDRRSFCSFQAGASRFASWAFDNARPSARPLPVAAVHRIDLTICRRPAEWLPPMAGDGRRARPAEVAVNRSDHVAPPPPGAEPLLRANANVCGLAPPSAAGRRTCRPSGGGRPGANGAATATVAAGSAGTCRSYARPPCRTGATRASQQRPAQRAPAARWM